MLLGQDGWGDGRAGDPDAAERAVSATIDAVHAGGINGWSEDNGRNPSATELVQANIVPPAPGVWLDENPAGDGFLVTVDEERDAFDRARQAEGLVRVALDGARRIPRDAHSHHVL